MCTDVQTSGSDSLVISSLHPVLPPLCNNKSAVVEVMSLLEDNASSQVDL